MLPEILISNLNVLFVGSTVAQTSDELGFYYLGPNNRFWSMLEYAGITPAEIVTPSDRKLLVDAKKDGVLNDIYKQLIFGKKEAQLLKNRIGLTDLNRRRVVSREDDPGAEPTGDDIGKFIRKVEKFRPAILGFVTGLDLFEKCFKPLYPSATRVRGKQDFMIGASEVWLLGSTSGRTKDLDALEQVFEALAERLGNLPNTENR